MERAVIRPSGGAMLQGHAIVRVAAPFGRCTLQRSPCSAPVAPAGPTSRAAVTCSAGSGFGGAGGGAAPAKTGGKKKPRLTRYLEVEEGSAAAEPDGWIEIPDVDFTSTFLSKPIKPIILATGRAIMLYKVENQMFCTDANSTAFKYPLADASILGLKTGPAVEVKLDGTVYDLATGKVISWCPKNSVVRSVLGSLKDKQDPQDLPVYPVRVDGKKVFVKLSAEK